MAEALAALSPLSVLQVLLVEDNLSDTHIVGGLLDDNSQTDYRVHHATLQAEALAALTDASFDVCLLDLSLPDAVGFSALLGLQEKAPDMPVLILTGTNDTATARHAVNRGAQDYLLKDKLEGGALTRSIDYAIERKRIEKELIRSAQHDALTGLANRSLFESRLKLAMARAQRSGTGNAVLFIDLDGFKPINDTYGHEAGDEVLKAMARRIKGVLRNYDTAARFGGDEFTVLLEDIDTVRSAAIIAQKILDAIAAPVLYRAERLAIKASIGIAFSEPLLSADALLKNADAAMYRAKSQGGGNYCFYGPDLHGLTQSRLKLEGGLRAALSVGQLRLHYQPYVVAGSQAILGVEALLRWAHPEHGMLYPDEFLALAEESKMMPVIGKWIFATLHKDIGAWNAQKLPPMQIAFNVCASQLDAPDFTRWLLPITEKNFLSGHSLVAEIAEDAVMPLSEPRFLTLAKLREMGVAVHLDHFGRGPVSLQSLQAFPFSLLKLDLSLIQRMEHEGNGDTLICVAIDLAHQMGMKAGAVGVESPWQLQALQKKNCDTMQGFLLGRPMTGPELARWVKDKKR
jgi:diguanylate cyclase